MCNEYMNIHIILMVVVAAVSLPTIVNCVVCVLVNLLGLSSILLPTTDLLLGKSSSSKKNGTVVPVPETCAPALTLNLAKL